MARSLTPICFGALFVLCVLSAGSSAAAEAALEACWSESANRIELGECLREARAASDAGLEEAYAAALGALDAVAGNNRATRTLEQAQSAFVLYRSLECQVQALQMGSGTGSGDAYLGCWIDMTRQRTAALGDLLPADANTGPTGTWRVVEITGDAVLADAQPIVVFETDGQISGNAGCNGYFGPAELDGDTIAVSELLGVTMKTCGPDIDEQESRFFAALQVARRVVADPPRLLLLSEGNETVLTLER